MTAGGEAPEFSKIPAKILRRILQIPFKEFVAPGLLALIPGAAVGQEVAFCDDYRSSAANLAEPWEENTRLYAKGAIRLAVIDTLEPAAGAFHLFILSPPLNELGLPQCRVVSMSGTMGFSYLGLDEARAAYDPAEGLAITLLAERWLSASDSYEPGELTVTINQQTGSIVPRFD